MSKTGTTYAVGGIGLLLIWSGVSNKGLLVSMRDLLQGVQPTAGPKQPFLSSDSSATPVAPGGSSSSNDGSVTASGGDPTPGSRLAQNQALGKVMASAYGWGSGPEWTALNNIVMAESGWDDGPNSANPTSDARGIAQNINGWSNDYQMNNPAQQIAWLLSYIKQRYGDPIKGWQFHLANGWY